MSDVALPQQPLRELALFAGAGGGILGGLLLGWRCVCAVEIDPYCRRVLLARQRDGILRPFPIWDDVRTFDGRPWRGRVGVVSGGFPCQPFSSASHGHRTAIDLWPEMLRIISECRPRYVIAKNVESDPIASAAIDLEIIGFSCAIARASAACVAAPHRRERHWLVADSDRESQCGLRINAEVAQSSAASISLWKEKYDASVLGVDDGVANRMDRLRALGNGQIPSVAALAWETLK